MTTPALVSDLTPDPANRRAHNPRNIDMITESLHAVGAARSISIDEDLLILAGNGVVQAAAKAGITKLRIIDTDGDEIIAVRRRGLTPEQKRALAMYDNRTGELATWNTEQLAADLKAGLDLKPFFFENELADLFGLEKGNATTTGSLIDRFGVPPFSVLDARQGYWQDRKRAWLALGIESELGRGGDIVPNGTTQPPEQDGAYRRAGRKPNATPGGSAMPGVRGPRKDYKPGKGRKVKTDVAGPGD